MYFANFMPLDHFSWGVGGWVWKLRLMLTQLPTKLELELGLSLPYFFKIQPFVFENRKILNIQVPAPISMKNMTLFTWEHKIIGNTVVYFRTCIHGQQKDNLSHVKIKFYFCTNNNKLK